MPGYWAPWPGKTNTVLLLGGPAVVLGQLGMGQLGAHRVQGAQQVLAGVLAVVGRGDAGAVRVLGAGDRQAVGHIGEIQIGMADQVFVQPVGLRAQCRGGTRRDRPDPQQWGGDRFAVDATAGSWGAADPRGRAKLVAG